MPEGMQDAGSHRPTRTARTKASATARPEDTARTVAMTANREWSLIPVTILHSRPSARKIPPTRSSCHRCIGVSRCRRLYFRRCCSPGAGSGHYVPGPGPRSPATRRPAPLLGRQPVRACPGPTGLLLEAVQGVGLVLGFPVVDRLPRHRVADGNLTDRRTTEHFENRTIALLDQQATLCPASTRAPMITVLRRSRQGCPGTPVNEVPRLSCRLCPEATHDSPYRTSADQINTLTKRKLVRAWLAILVEPRRATAFAGRLDMDWVFDQRCPGLR